MGRGQKLFNSLFAELLPLPEKQEGKGRSDIHIQKRNELMVYRYLYYGMKMPHSQGLVIKHLSDELFLSERRVLDVLSEMSILLKRARIEAPSTIELRKRWPHLVW